MIKMALLMFPLFSFCLVANAVKIVRTGGDALVCENWESTRNSETGAITVELKGYKYLALDIEANRRPPYLLSPKVDDLSGNPYRRAEQIIERLRWLDPLRVEKYLRWLRKFKAEQIDEDRLFPDVPDSEHFVQPLDCELVQAIIQEHEDGRVRYRMSFPVLNKMDPNNFAFMIVHELVYRDAFESGHRNSFFVSHFTALLASDAVGTMTRATYQRKLRELGIQ